MLREEFETWSTYSIANETLVNLGLHVNTLGYLKDGLSCFMKLLDGSTKKSSKLLIGLNTTIAIPDNKV